MGILYWVGLGREQEDGSIKELPQRYGYERQETHFGLHKGEDGLPRIFNVTVPFFGDARQDWGLVTHGMLFNKRRDYKLYKWFFISVSILTVDEPVYLMPLKIPRSIPGQCSAQLGIGQLEIICMSNM